MLWEINMRYNQACKVLFYEEIIETLAFVNQGLSSIPSQNQDFILLQKLNSFFQMLAVFIGLNLALQNDRVKQLVFILFLHRLLRIRFWYLVNMDTDLHNFLLQVSCPPQEWFCMAFNQRETVEFL